MRRSRLAGALTALTLACMSASMAAPAAGEEVGRYTMSPAGDGFARLDTKTGAMALCHRKDGDEWACEDMADSQRTLREENTRLETENQSLKEQIQGLESSLGLGEGEAAAPSDAPKPGAKLTLPSEEDVDKAFDYLERMAKKLHERMDRLEKEHSGKPGEPGTEL